MDISRTAHIEVEHIVLLCIPLGQCLGIRVSAVGQIWAGVLGQRMTEGCRLLGGETESKEATPQGGQFNEANADSLVDANGSVAEANALAEAAYSGGHGATCGDANIFTVNGVEGDWRQVICRRVDILL